MALFGKIRKKARRLSGKMDQYQEAVTFAEAGAPELADQPLHMETAEEERPGKLLVVGRESYFSREVIEYALDMARRLSYEIVALNTAPLSCDTFKLFSSSQKQICNDFRALCEKNVDPFRAEAEKLEIPFAHVVKYSEPDDAIREVRQEMGEFDFVVSEAEEDRVADRIEQGERPQQEICVYSMV